MAQRISHQVFDSKNRGRGLVQRARQALGWSDGPEGVKASGPTGGNWSGFTGGEMSGPGAGVQGGETSGDAPVVQPGPEGVVQPVAEPGEPSGIPSGIELHIVDGRLLACNPGEPPPLSVREHTKAFLEWLRDHEKAPGVEVPVAVLEHVLYWDFLRDTGLPMKSWRTVSDILAKLPGVKKYQADWRDPTGEGPTPIVFKVSKRRRAKVVEIAAVGRKRA